MTKTKKAISLILAVAMIFTAMLGCMTITSSATEGQVGGEGPKLVDYSIEVDNTDPKTEYGSQITVTLEFDKAMGSTSYTKSAFDISINNNSLANMGFEITGVTPEGNNLVITLQGIDKGEDSWAYVISGKFDISLKSNYYEDIVDTDGNQVSDWTDIHTYVQTGLEFMQTASVSGGAETPASVTFQLTGDAKLRGASPVQILVGGKSIVCTEVFPGQGEDGGDLTLGGNCNESRGTVNVHTHMYLTGTNESWAKALAGNFHSKDYEMAAEKDTVTITAKENGENTALAENTVMRAFGYSAPNDSVVQETLFKEEIAAAEARLAEISGGKVTPEAKAALEAAVTAAKEKQAAISGETTAVEFQKMRAALQSAVDGAKNNAIETTFATRSNGTVNLSLAGGDSWIQAVTAVKINGTELTDDDYEIADGVLSVTSLTFDTEGQTTPKTKDYEITVEADGYDTVTQTVTVNFYGASTFTIRLLDKNNKVVEERTYTRDEIIAYSQDETTGGQDKLFSTACSMTGSRAFKGSGAYLSTLIKEAGIAEGTDFNPDTTKVKFRTNDSNDETDINDDPSVDSYFGMITTDYTELMSPRYYFQDLYNHDSELYKVYKESASIDQDDDDAVEAYNLELRRAMAASNKVEVEPMIAYEFSEDANVDLDDVPLDNPSHESYEYDQALAKDKSFRFLLGTGMVEKNGETLSSTLNTTMRATYQLYGIDLVDSSLGGSSGSSGGGGGGSAVTNYTVTFDSNGGSSVTKQTVASGKTVSEPADPTREGYVFDGWYIDKELTDAYDFGDKVTKSFTLYAKWTEEDTEPDPGEEPGEEPGTDPGTGDTPNFSDVPADSWYAEYVTYLAERGIVNGKTATTFEPDSRITRAEFIKIIAEVAGADVTGQTSSKFSDVASGSWYAPYVAWGVENGLINGVSDTQFDPNGNITRQDMATLISRYAGFAEFELPQTEEPAAFSDASDIASYAQDAVSQMQRAGIINGRGDNTFAPQDNATRAEACKMLTILMQQMGR